MRTLILRVAGDIGPIGEAAEFFSEYQNCADVTTARRPIVAKMYRMTNYDCNLALVHVHNVRCRASYVLHALSCKSRKRLGRRFSIARYLVC